MKNDATGLANEQTPRLFIVFWLYSAHDGAVYKNLSRPAHIKAGTYKGRHMENHTKDHPSVKNQTERQLKKLLEQKASHTQDKITHLRTVNALDKGRIQSALRQWMKKD